MPLALEARARILGTMCDIVGVLGVIGFLRPSAIHPCTIASHFGSVLQI